jgi:hypothetical protein
MADRIAPKIRASPDVRSTRPRSMPIVVVFPEPFGPRKPNTPPLGTRSES